VEQFGKNIDFGIVVTHNGNPSMTEFQRILKPKYGYYDIEHDVFNHLVEVSPIDMSLGSFAFTKVNSNYLSSRKRKYFEASWYKLDGLTEVDLNFSEPCVKNAILSDTSFTDRNKSFEYKHLFDKVYLKNYTKTPTGLSFEKELITNLDLWWDTQAVVDMKDLGYFWFCMESSMIVEALMLNRLPILWRSQYSNEKSIDDIVSEVRIGDLGKRNFHNFGRNFYFITDKNIEYKINILQNDNKRRESVLNLLKSQWLFDEPKRKVADILIDDMNNYL
jgi:hypothetical protein